MLDVRILTPPPPFALDQPDSDATIVLTTFRALLLSFHEPMDQCVKEIRARGDSAFEPLKSFVKAVGTLLQWAAKASATLDVVNHTAFCAHITIVLLSDSSFWSLLSEQWMYVRLHRTRIGY